MSIFKQQAMNLYQLCDTEQKGFISRQDLERLSEYMDNAQALQDVFDSLDVDGNGELTFDEFVSGFSEYLGAPMAAATANDSERKRHKQQTALSVDEDEMDSELFYATMPQLGIQTNRDDLIQIKEIWIQIKRKNPELLQSFENSLANISQVLNKKMGEYGSLESTMKQKFTSFEEEVQQTLEEMDIQIKNEKEKLKHLEQEREKSFKEKLENEIKEKDQEMQEIMKKHEDTFNHLRKLNQQQTDSVQEKDRLEKERIQLESVLQKLETELNDAQYYVDDLKRKEREEKRKRARAAIEMNETIALERESLVRQLDALREANEMLQKEKDLKLKQKRLASQDSTSGENLSILDPLMHNRNAKSTSENTKKKKKRANPNDYPNSERKGSVLGCYFNSKGSSTLQNELDNPDGIEESNHEDDMDDSDEVEEVAEFDSANFRQFVTNAALNSSMRNTRRINQNSDQPTHEKNDVDLKSQTSSNSVLSCQEKPKKQHLNRKHRKDDKKFKKGSLFSELSASQQSESMDKNNELFKEKNPEKEIKSGEQSSFDILDTDDEILKKTTENADSTELARLSKPERIFKVVFVGDSYVGKTSILQRLCNNSFRTEGYSSTIGVDFRIKPIVLEDSRIALQLWDTAGQERFQSITRSYYRKSDAVVITYDMTNVNTFIHARDWIENVKEDTNDSSVCLMLLGNKKDLRDEEEGLIANCVKSEEGERFASENDAALFFEVSAKSAENIEESFKALAKKLKEKQDVELENSIRVLPDAEKKQKKCCG